MRPQLGQIALVHRPQSQGFAFEYQRVAAIQAHGQVTRLGRLILAQGALVGVQHFATAGTRGLNHTLAHGLALLFGVLYLTSTLNGEQAIMMGDIFIILGLIVILLVLDQ